MPPSSAATIEISKDYLHFNAAHFTLFSATEREDLHGHTFYVAATVTSPVGDDGLAFDYNLFKNALKALCDELDEKVLLPSRGTLLDKLHQLTVDDEQLTHVPIPTHLSRKRWPRQHDTVKRTARTEIRKTIRHDTQILFIFSLSISVP